MIMFQYVLFQICCVSLRPGEFMIQRVTSGFTVLGRKAFSSIMSKFNVVFVLGGPGAGKGTQCSKIVDVSYLLFTRVNILLKFNRTPARFFVDVETEPTGIILCIGFLCVIEYSRVLAYLGDISQNAT